MKRFVLEDSKSHITPESYTVDYQQLLNSRQYEAVFHNEGPLLVIAGAGTGKTRTLTYRVARLVESGIRPNEILLLTFTRRAANQMLSRSSRILDDRCKQVKGGTFHFYCSRLLRRYATKIGFNSDFTILDTADARETIRIVQTSMDIKKNKGRFPNYESLLAIHSTAINKMKSVEEIINEKYSQFYSYHRVINELLRKYTAYKKSRQLMDFDDLLINTISLLDDHVNVRKKVALAHRHVMVDEYQDINPLQAKLTELFSSVHKNVMVVGDDAQCIYSFRGAEHQHIMDFPDHFSGCRIIKLEKNYRSTQPILNLANELLLNAQHHYEKRLFSDNDQGMLPALVKADTVDKQSQFVTQMVLKLRDEGHLLNDSAVLMRNGRDSYELELELSRNNIPFVKYGGQKLTEAAHVKDVLAHLRVLINPKDIIAWNRVLLLLDGIGPKTAQEIFDWAQSEANPYLLDRKPSINSRYAEQLKALSQLFDTLKSGNKNPSAMVSEVVAYYETFCKKQFDDYPKRLKDLEAFTAISEQYNSVQKMLEELTLDPIQMTSVDVEEEEDDENPLVLSTIHSAKGLEWKNVFVIQCLDGIIPSGYAIENDDNVEEERRLFYVACTRAAEHLFLCYPVVHMSGFGDYFTKPSRFVEGIDEELLEPWVLVSQHSNSHSIEESESDSGEEPKQLT